jgi:hypothetical protein
MTQADATRFAHALKLQMGGRALAVAERQRDGADGGTRASWETIVTALRELAEPSVS